MRSATRFRFNAGAGRALRTAGRTECTLNRRQRKILLLQPKAAAFTSFLPELSQAAGGGLGDCVPSLPTPPCSLRAKHYTMLPLIPVLQHVTGQEQLRELWVFGERGFPGVWKGALLCSLLTIASWGAGGGESGVAFPGHSSGYPTSADPVASAASRNLWGSPP